MFHQMVWSSEPEMAISLRALRDRSKKKQGSVLEDQRFHLAAESISVCQILWPAVNDRFQAVLVSCASVFTLGSIFWDLFLASRFAFASSIEFLSLVVRCSMNELFRLELQFKLQLELQLDVNSKSLDSYLDRTTLRLSDCSSPCLFGSSSFLCDSYMGTRLSSFSPPSSTATLFNHRHQTFRHLRYHYPNPTCRLHNLSQSPFS